MMLCIWYVLYTSLFYLCLFLNKKDKDKLESFINFVIYFCSNFYISGDIIFNLCTWWYIHFFLKIYNSEIYIVYAIKTSYYKVPRLYCIDVRIILLSIEMKKNISTILLHIYILNSIYILYIYIQVL